MQWARSVKEPSRAHFLDKIAIKSYGYINHMAISKIMRSDAVAFYAGDGGDNSRFSGSYYQLLSIIQNGEITA